MLAVDNLPFEYRNPVDVEDEDVVECLREVAVGSNDFCVDDANES